MVKEKLNFYPVVMLPEKCKVKAKVIPPGYHNDTWFSKRTSM